MKNRLIALLLLVILGTSCLLPALADGEANNYNYNYNSNYNYNTGYNYNFLYIIPDSNTRLLTYQELTMYTYETLSYIRNEILARHGYAFRNTNLYSYFDAKPWYHAGGYTSMNVLTPIERQNHALVRQVEIAMVSSKNNKANATDISTIIATQNAMGGYGNINRYGNPYGNGEGQTASQSYYYPTNPPYTYPTQVPYVYPTQAPAPTATLDLSAQTAAAIARYQASAKPNFIYTVDYIGPDSNKRLMTSEELWAYSRETLRYIRNEILARHGYNFGNNKFGNYFITKSWYKAGNNNDAVNNKVTSVEWKNINLIRDVEALMDNLGTENPGGLDISVIVQNQLTGNTPGK